jgi:hypothetical protein
MRAELSTTSAGGLRNHESSGCGAGRQRTLPPARNSPAPTFMKPIMYGAVERVRPKMMTVVAIMAGLCRSCGAPEPAPK